MAAVRDTSSIGFLLLWILSAIVGAVGLALAYGFREPPVSDRAITGLLMASGVLLLVSRLALLVPRGLIGPRMRCWWPDFVLLAAAIVWLIAEPFRAPVILRLAVLYAIAYGLGLLLWNGVLRVTDMRSPLRRPVWTLAGGLLVAALVSGAVLSLPVFWASPVTGQKLAQYAKHVVQCTFVATAALTGTGLSPVEIGRDFSPAGHVLILVLMQLGGLAMLVVGGVAALRLRAALGWDDAELTTVRARRFVLVVCVAALGLEALGAAATWRMWEVDRESAASRWLASAFHSISALCNCGLTFKRDGLVAYADRLPTYLVILSLMLLGSLGGPTLWDLLRRRISRASRITLIGSGVLVLVTAGLLVTIESTRRLQLRYPREDIPGRIDISATQSGTDVIVFSSETDRARRERLAHQPVLRRAAAGLFQAVAARSGGTQVVRMDEASLAPASRWVLSAAMVIGGAVGGTAGGVRILVVVVLLWCVFRPSRVDGAVARVIPTLASVAAVIVLLTAAGTLLLMYRETGSPEACFFEVVSAACNVGFHTGTTPLISPEGRVTLVVVMVLGRALPVAMLLRGLREVRRAEADVQAG